MYDPRHLFPTMPPVTSAARNQPWGDFYPREISKLQIKTPPHQEVVVKPVPTCVPHCPSPDTQRASCLKTPSLSWTPGDFTWVHANPTLTRGLQALHLITMSLLSLKCILGCVTWNSGCPGRLQGGGEDTSSQRSLGPKPQGPRLVSGDESLSYCKE